MALIGKRNRLPFLHEASPGFYLDGGSHGEILLPGSYLKGADPGREVDVFIYRDSEDRLVATTDFPHAMVGEFAYLRVVSLHARMGAFLDWGLPKDLLLPPREQAGPVSQGDWTIVHVYLDPASERVVASSKLDRWLDLTPPPYTEGQAVRFLVIGETPLGYNAIVENAHRGLLYHTDLAVPLSTGQTLDGFVRAIRPDGKIDLALDPVGFGRIKSLREDIMEALEAAGGRLPFHDKSSSEEIRAAFGVSKKAFKQAIGVLYRKRRIDIEAHGIRLVKPGIKT